MSISERLQMVIKMNGMTNASFADEIGVQRSSISHVLAGRNKPSIDFIQKILTTFPKVNADWLITGKKIGRTLDATEEDVVAKPKKENVVPNSALDATLKEEEQGGYNADSSRDSGYKTQDNESSQRKITKILVFYDDGTFEEMMPKH